ncbi:MAG TPA: bacillithiol system redox-active protein YtxJ [Cytophagales bacterium]|nr:bacillithiol system redox-active protein YtxJ [Cytophagales bacterium]
MNWKHLEDVAQLEQIVNESENKPVMIFKHSTRCSISASALNRVERAWAEKADETLTPYFLDLLNHREISNEISSRFNIEHQSPQALVISKGKCVYDASHMNINLPEIISQAQFVA